VQDSTAIHLKRLQKKGGRDSVTDARLHNREWPNDSSQRVTEPGELDVTIVKGTEWRIIWQCLLQEQNLVLNILQFSFLQDAVDVDQAQLA
jgi:hypothetical protein